MQPSVWKNLRAVWLASFVWKSFFYAEAQTLRPQPRHPDQSWSQRMVSALRASNLSLPNLRRVGKWSDDCVYVRESCGVVLCFTVLCSLLSSPYPLSATPSFSPIVRKHVFLTSTSVRKECQSWYFLIVFALPNWLPFYIGMNLWRTGCLFCVE